MKKIFKIIRNCFDMIIITYLLISLFRFAFNIKMHYDDGFIENVISSSSILNNTAIYLVANMDKLYNFTDAWQIAIETAVIVIVVGSTIYLSLGDDKKWKKDL